MELRDLTASERVTLIALAHFCLLADDTLSVDEESVLGDLVERMGVEQYQAAASVARARISDFAALRAAVAEVIERAARELIYGTLLELAIPDSINNNEAQLLELLEAEWGITTEPTNFPIHDPSE
jgi:hypothetical protein